MRASRCVSDTFSIPHDAGGRVIFAALLHLLHGEFAHEIFIDPAEGVAVDVERREGLDEFAQDVVADRSVVLRQRVGVNSRGVGQEIKRQKGGGSYWLYRSAPAALSTKSSPSRTYRASMASLAWPVCALILSVETPACTALVAALGGLLRPFAGRDSLRGDGSFAGDATGDQRRGVDLGHGHILLDWRPL